jgi:hypothetical protein
MDMKITAIKWKPEYRLLLIYKDPIGKDRIAGSPLKAPSRSLAEHLSIAHGKIPREKFGLESTEQGEETNSQTLLDALPPAVQEQLFPLKFKSRYEIASHYRLVTGQV